MKSSVKWFKYGFGILDCKKFSNCHENAKPCQECWLQILWSLL